MQKNIIVATILGLLFSTPAFAQIYPDGSVLKSIDTNKVYVLEHGQKRWMESEDVYFAQGFTWADLKTVSPSALVVYPEGEIIERTDVLDLPREGELIPDLVPLPYRDLALQTENGRNVIRFTASFWNKGSGPLELAQDASRPSVEGEIQVVQQLRRSDGSVRSVDVGHYIHHEIHDHLHFDEFSEYRIEPAESSMAEVQMSSRNMKASYCLRDDASIDLSLEHAVPGKTFFDCDSTTQGVSVGWSDVYSSALTDQFLDVQDLPKGFYRMIFDINPMGKLVEETTANNRSTVLIYLDVEANELQVLASLEPRSGAPLILEDGLLLKGDKSSRVYVTEDGKKRWLQSEDVFQSYGYPWTSVLEIPQELIETIPSESFVRTGAGDVYMLNEDGYVRRILNPTVLASYGTGDIPLINAVELNGYVETSLIQKTGDDLVYSTYSKTAVGFDRELALMNIDSRSVQQVNDEDVRSYAVSTVAEGLNVPWDIAFLPGGDMLVTERSGTLRRYGSSPESFSVPGVVHVGEGGLMGIAVHPEFADNHYIYLAFTTNEEGSENRVVRYRLEDNQLTQDRVILDRIPAATYHDGGQIAFGPDGMLYITTGDAGDASLAQDTSSLAGKILRLTEDGEIPVSNPFGSAVWSYGHRNGQGLAWDHEGSLWATEHGRSGSSSGYDELNSIESGANYGWPNIQGAETQSGMHAPAIQSGATVTWAPSGLAYWNGVLYFSGLRGSRLYAAEVENGQVRSLNEYLKDEFGRLRAAVIGPDGMLYLTTSNRDGRGSAGSLDDRVIKIAPGMLGAL